MSSFIPPNPRDAKNRQVMRTWHNAPITIVLAILCMITAFRSQVGKNNPPVDWMFFQSQARQLAWQEEYEAAYEQWERMIDQEGIFDEEGNVINPVFEKVEAEMERLDRELQKGQKKGDVLSDIKKGEVWRLFTPMFLHFGVLHIAFNLYWLWTLGALLEIRYRSGRFLLLVLVLAFVSNVPQALFSGSNFGGMSGVNYGLFGFMWFNQKYHPTPSFRIDTQTIFIMVGWLVICFLGAAGNNIANWAHGFGFLGGASISFAIAMMAGGAKLIRRRSEFRRAISEAKTMALHQCKVCGITEHDNADTEFRVCADGEEYCDKHLPS